MAHITVLNGPNLNLLGTREPEIYGTDTLADLETRLKRLAESHGHTLDFHQSNAEHILVDLIHAAWSSQVGFIIINPAAFTHTSIAIRDAFLATRIPFVEVHLSNVYAREPFRHHSYLSDIAYGIICGLGTYGYELALYAAIRYLGKD